MNYFEYDTVPLVHIGFTKGTRRNSMLPVRLDVRDMRTVYSGYDLVATTDGPLPDDLSLDVAMLRCAAGDEEANGCYVYREGGEHVEFHNWTLSSYCKGSNNRVDV